MLKKTLSRFALSALLISSAGLATSLARNPEQSLEAQTGTLEKMIVAGGNVALNLDLNRLQGRGSQETSLDTFRFGIDSNSFFTVLAFDHAFRGPQPGTMKLLWGNSATLPAPLNASADQLVIEKTNSGSAFDLVVRDGRTGFLFFNIEGINYDFNASQHSLDVADARLLISPELAAQLGRSADAGARVGTLSINASVNSYEVSTIVNGATQSAVLPSRANPDDPDSVPGPDVIVGDLPSMDQFGTAGTQVGLGIGTTSCNNGTVDLNWFALPQVDHPVIPQNLYRMSGGAN